MPTFDSLLRDLRSQVLEIDADALDRDLKGSQRPTLIDVREADEHAEGMIPGTLHIPRGFLELRVEKAVLDRAAPVVLYCAAGTRSVLSCRSLAELGYANVRSLAGGFAAWKRAGLSWEQPITLRADQASRYSRHTMLPEVGVAGQLKLLASKVLCIGAGGLGSPLSVSYREAGWDRSIDQKKKGEELKG